MPTATSFMFNFPWQEMIGIFNSFILVFKQVLPIVAAFAVVFGPVIGFMLWGFRELKVNALLRNGAPTLEDHYYEPYYPEETFDKYNAEEKREMARKYLRDTGKSWF